MALKYIYIQIDQCNHDDMVLKIQTNKIFENFFFKFIIIKNGFVVVFSFNALPSVFY